MADPANGLSARFCAEIGIAPGMRVLDVGCGNGDLSRLVAGLAGSEGEVVAIDRSAEAMVTGGTADADPPAAPIRYRQADLIDTLPDLGRFALQTVRFGRRGCEKRPNGSHARPPAFTCWTSDPAPRSSVGLPWP